MIKLYFNIKKKSLIFGGHGVKKHKSKIYDVIENFRIQYFGNPNTLISCTVHFDNDGMLFTALSSLDFEIKAFKNSPAA